MVIFQNVFSPKAAGWTHPSFGDPEYPENLKVQKFEIFKISEFKNDKPENY